jgi:hypothetical protein
MFGNWSDENKPVSECPPIYDSKWRFFWFIGERNKELDKDMLIFPNIIPQGFPHWEKVMNNWGKTLLTANETSAQMAAIGFGLDEFTFVEKMKYGGHLLAPTGSDLGKFKKDTIFAGFHYDLNFLTIHGKSNYGGLFIWLRNGKKVKVKVPDGCLLLQAGRQFEYLTGGECLNGFHEVVYTEEVEKIVEKKREENSLIKNEEDRHKLWRVSSTLFSQIRQNVVLEPIGRYKNSESARKYPPILTRDQVAEELKSISLMMD